MPGPAAPGRWSGDAAAVIILVALPVIVYGVPALLGHAVVPGDDLTQNFPLRVLAGRQIRGGHLPLYDPYIWSGAPLLGGWNAAAAYPLTLLFAIVPPAAAWALNMIATWAAAGLGMFFFLRALRLASLPSLLGALSFAFAGAMSAQVAHFGLVAGMSWVPLQLLGVLRLSQDRNAASRMRWTAVLGGAFGLTILAGEPRAIDDACVIVFIYAAWQIARLGRQGGPAALSVAAGLTLGICLGAVQWMPGLAAVHTSQRAASSVGLFNSGSLSTKWLLLLMLVPDVLGGSGSFGQPTYFASYNLAEVTGYVGIFPLVAAAVLLGRLRLRPRPGPRLPEWFVWHGLALAGVLLALGGKTPLGHLLVHLPLFGDQRLQSRNILVADLALAVLLGYWANDPLGDKAGHSIGDKARGQPGDKARHPLRDGTRRPRPPGGRRMGLETVLGVVPPLAMIAVVAVGLCWGAGLLRWLGVSAGTAAADGRLKPWLVPYALIGAAAMAFVIFGPRLRPRLRSRWLGSLVVTDLLVFTLLAVVAVAAGLGGSTKPTASHGTRAADSTIVSGRSRAGTSAPRPIAALGYPGRFAIYDPGEIDAGELPVLGAPDLNVTSGTPSVQGYSAIVNGFYASATGSHQVTGQGQDVLAPRAIADGALDQLDTSVLLTVPGYLVTAAGGPGPSPGPPGTGRRAIAAGHRGTWYLGTPLEVSGLDVPDARARHDASAGIRLGLVTPQGSTRWFAASAAGASLLAVRLRHPVASVAVVGQAGRAPCRLGPPSMAEPDGSVFVANGQLQNAVMPPRWGPAGYEGSFTVFADRFARGMLSLQALPGRSSSGASVRRVAGSAADPTAAAVRSAHGVRVIRAVAAIAGWSASWHPRDGRATTLAVRRDGLVQAVRVPPGRGVLTWSYLPPWCLAGFALSLGAIALILLLVAGPGPLLRLAGRSTG